MGDAQVRAQLAQPRRHQVEVVVLHQHLRRLGRLGRERVRERRVVPLVRRPLPPPAEVENRPLGSVVEHVVDEPDGRVRHPVVRPAERGRVQCQHPHVQVAGVVAGPVQVTVGSAPGGGPFPLVQRRTHPQAVHGRQCRAHAADQAAAAAAHLVVAVVAGDDAQRSAIRRHQQRRAARLHVEVPTHLFDQPIRSAAGPAHAPGRRGTARRSAAARRCPDDRRPTRARAATAG